MPKDGDREQAAPRSRFRLGPAATATVWNLAGSAAPLVAGVVAFPLLNRGLGTERVGFLTLAWALIGYFGLFDLGLGRALTKLVAERIAASEQASLPRLIRTALALMLALGVVAGLLLALGAAALVEGALRIPPELRAETVRAIQVLAWSVPLVVTSAGLRGVLEAQGRFGIVNAIRAPLGAWLIAGPLLVLPFGSQDLGWAAGLLFLGRLAAWAALAIACWRAVPGLLHGDVVDRRQVGPLLRFGGWMTVSNVVSPIMVYLDRFLLGNQVSLEAVAWYATPWEMVTKLLVVPGAIVTVLFPLFSRAGAQGADSSARLYEKAVRVTILLMLAPTFLVALFAREGLTLWLGAPFAEHAFTVAQIIAFGTLFNAIAHVPFALVQGTGRPDLTAKIHLVELPLYLALVLILTHAFGIAGTAAAWAIRMVLDLALLHAVARKSLGLGRAGPGAWIVPLGAVALFACALAPLGLAPRLGLAATVVAGAGWAGRNLLVSGFMGAKPVRSRPD